ncbi:hypothetical protein FC83_GL000206 [Agrilactobacillus composti DSM 18527 = JCM 14202]|uniref:Uncharacterized protein n=1 Tax=Agrilactobacillus composti DSM 18527 = JCM 14202 TaxID=1423734 RepID=X0PFD1_9LACO|nr:hypothetical protein [Agrilactobacillus composti]KRM32804.1 hypothetical protein FC83_GL000206 [Agrilactobacillus composti DSM 18527 = JCM 14202]GAF40609.1 hypothetical protein JCM14202_2513 [Agrilactobacillus composti DSM 18527 = JCM 14202]
MSKESEFWDLYYQEFDKYWDDFKQSSEYEQVMTLFLGRKTMIKTAVENMLNFVLYDTPKPIDQWKFSDIKPVRSSFHYLYRNKSTNKNYRLIVTDLTVVRYWLQWLTEIGALHIEYRFIENLFKDEIAFYTRYDYFRDYETSCEAEVSSNKSAEKRRIEQKSARKNARKQSAKTGMEKALTGHTRKNSKKISKPAIITDKADRLAKEDRLLNEMDSELLKLIKAFENDPKWRIFTQQFESEYIETLITRIADKMSFTFHEDPDQWDEEGFQETLKWRFALEMNYFLDELPGVAQILQNFLTFEGEVGYLKPAKAESLKQALIKILPKVKATLSDEANFESEKRLVLGMRRAGIDEQKDWDLMDQFIEDYNVARQTARAAEGRAFFPEIVYMPALKYKKLAHSRQGYSKQIATKVHNEILARAWQLWSTHQEWYHKYKQAQIVDYIVDLGDLIYARYLQTPKQWQLKDFAGVLPDFVKQLSPADVAVFKLVWTTLLDTLAKNGSLEPAIAYDVARLVQETSVIGIKPTSSNI